MKLKFILLWALLAPLFTLSAALQQEAAEAYNAGQFALSAERYEALVAEGYESADLHYNLGNAYYKEGRVAAAILNFERALLLSPGDEDIRTNLEIAKLQTVDKIEPLGRIFLLEWIVTLLNTASSNGWAKVAIVAFLLLLSTVALYFFANRSWARKVGFFAGVVLLFLVIFANYAASHQKSRLTERTSAIVVAKSVTCKSTPAMSGTNLFVLHEGTKVTLKSKLGEWSEIQLADGNVAWIPTADIVQI